MSNEQLYLSSGVPILFNAAMTGMLLAYINTRFDSMEKMWRGELRRVEDVMDARLKSLEERLKNIEEAHA